MNQIVTLTDLATGARPAFAGAAPLQIEIRPLTACAEIRAAWSDLAGRALESNPFFEPDFALAAAQHLVAFRRATVILIWQGRPVGPERRLVGLLPCFPRNRLFVPDELIGFADPRIFNGAPLLDRTEADAALEAVLNLRQGWDLTGRGLILREIDLRGPLLQALLRVSDKLGLAATMRQAGPPASADTPARLTSPMPAQHGQLRLVESGSRLQVRDAVEIVLGLEGSGERARAGTATVQDTREVGFLRAMTRNLARARQCRVGLLMLGEQPIAGAIVLGRAQRGWLYVATQDEAHAALEPERRLLALMRQAAPARSILRRGGALAESGDDAAIGEVRLQPRAALAPRDLAARARDALRRSGFRLPRAGAAG